MNIRPKNAILFAQTGVKFSQNNLGGANWRQQVFNNYRQHLLDQLASYGQDDNYGYWLNDMQSRHAQIYDMANKSGDWQKIAYKNDLVGQYQHDYKGDQRFGTYNPGNNYQTDFNQLGIVKAQEQNRYDISGPRRTSGDYGNHDFQVDNLYSAITDDRRLLGRKGDWDENSDEFKTWQKDLNSRGWETYLDTTDNYYKIRRLKDSLNAPPSDTTQQQTQKQNGVQVGAKDDTPNDFWSRLQTGFKNIAPDLLDALRLAGNMHNNERVYNESMKAIIPNLQQSYHTYRQVVGDEATKQAYYRRAVQGQTKAGQPFTSDADRQMAYMQEARRIGDELRAQGDLADNQRIRETSAEAAAHADANIERDTTIANQNITELNKAAAAKHQLTAQKYSADWTNIDQYLLGWQARLQQKKTRQDAIEDQIKTLQMQDNLANDPGIKAAYDNLEAEAKKLYPNGEVNWYDPKLQDARNKLSSARRQAYIKQYSLLYGKQGTKITKKDTTDRYLYRTSRDIVEHFRRMSKMTDDSRIRTMPKAAKMPSHPKKKLQLGGVAPFTVYRPLGIGGETTTQVSQSTDGTSKSTKDTTAKDKLDMIKEMFKAVQSTGLPVDVNVVYRDLNNLFSRAQAFGEELSSDDIATIYLQSMQKISNLKYSKENYDKALAVATQNDSLNEFAVDASGNYVVQDKEGNLNVAKSLSEIAEKGLNPITNQQLLNLRAYSPNMAFQRGDSLITNIINNGMGINKIGAQIKALAGSLGSTEGKLEGISQVESGKVKAGLQILAGAPDGYYKITTETKSQKEQVNAALSYIENMLSPAQRAILDSHGGTKPLIQAFLTSQQDATENITISPLTGKAAKDSNGKTGGKGGTDTPASVQFLLGNGYSEVVEFNIGNSQSVKALGRFGILQDKEKNNLGQGSTLQDVSKSQFGPILDLDKATFGGTRLTNGYSHIILNNSDCIGVDLPVKKDLSGNYIPDFQQLSLIEKAEERIHNNKITDPQQINQIYKDLGLPDKFDSNGNIIQQNYKRFAGIQVILDEKALKGGVPINMNEVSEADDEERELFIEQMKKSGNKDYDLSDGILWSSWGRDKLYKGTIFVPVREDIAAGYTSGGYPLDTDIPNNANQVAIMQYAPKTQQYQKTPPLSSLK